MVTVMVTCFGYSLVLTPGHQGTPEPFSEVDNLVDTLQRCRGACQRGASGEP